MRLVDKNAEIELALDKQRRRGLSFVDNVDPQRTVKLLKKKKIIIIIIISIIIN